MVRSNVIVCFSFSHWIECNLATKNGSEVGQAEIFDTKVASVPLDLIN